MKHFYSGFLFLGVLMITGCSNDSNKIELEQFYKDMKSDTYGGIEPIPETRKIEYFAYSASGLKSPFQKLKSEEEEKGWSGNAKPDPNRQKEFLEQFDVASFSMVGFIRNNGGVWGLVKQAGKIYKVTVGGYLGRNHGRITVVGDESIEFVELTPVGPDNWIQRQRRLPMYKKNKSE